MWSAPRSSSLPQCRRCCSSSGYRTCNQRLFARSAFARRFELCRTQIEMPVTCTYDFDVVSAKYFHALDKGDIPLEFLFSGTIFYEGPGGRLQIVQIPWEKEAEFRLPVSVWKQMMEHFFPNSAWLRLNRDTFNRLYGYKARLGLASWEAALEGLLRASDERTEKVEP